MLFGPPFGKDFNMCLSSSKWVASAQHMMLLESPINIRVLRVVLAEFLYAFCIFLIYTSCTYSLSLKYKQEFCETKTSAPGCLHALIIANLSA